ncbi:MAG: DUF697 domain-containing protein [Syntrophorhabdaceae bacterium]|nr:DUF697 domain-containing protein [Syntrophorhabdaceae bacterium]
MRKKITIIALTAAILIFALFVVFVINQSIQLVAFGDRIHPLVGDIVLWGLAVFYVLCVAVPLYLFATMPAPLVPPESEASAEFPGYLNKMAKRLSENPLVGKHIAGSKEDVESALQILDRKADDAIKKAASYVFVTTAISQNGKLDAFFVLSVQSKLVLEVARIYYQRPTMRNLFYLYTNVAAMVLFASELEDMDLSEVIQPVLTGILGSATGAIPGFQVASMIFVTSVISGSSNAFLTLRVGAITRQYCRSLVVPPKQAVRRFATLEATRMLGTIVADGAKKVSTAIWALSKGKMGATVGGVKDYVRNAGTTISRKIRIKRAVDNKAER